MDEVGEIACELWEAESIYIQRPLFNWKNGGPVLVWDLMTDREKGVYRRMACTVCARIRAVEKEAIDKATRTYTESF